MDFIAGIDALDDSKLKLLAALIAKGTLDIKIAVTQSAGIYHDKLGILDDADGNTIVFYGSSITEGGCASRPGNTYQGILSRRLNTEHINWVSPATDGENKIWLTILPAWI